MQLKTIASVDTPMIIKLRFRFFALATASAASLAAISSAV
jgi:hypothetical protein